MSVQTVNNWNMINKQNINELSKEAANFQREDWKALAKIAPIDVLLYGIRYQCGKMQDKLSLIESASAKVETFYSDDDMEEWV